MRAKSALDNPVVPVKAKISALWAAVELCYLYGDVIGFHTPGALQRILDGKMGFWPITPVLLLGVAIVQSIPAIMVASTLLLWPALSRWLNVLLGAAYTALMLYTMIDAWKYGFYFYMYFGVVESLLTLLVVWYALAWPRPPAAN
jgi:hypothetical protein